MEGRVGHPEELFATGFSVLDLDLEASGQAKHEFQAGGNVLPKRLTFSDLPGKTD